MNGKDKCKILKDIRQQIAEENGIEYHSTQCTHEGNCAGTCPKCEEELEELQKELDRKGISHICMNSEAEEKITRFSADGSEEDSMEILQGEPVVPDHEGMPFSEFDIWTGHQTYPPKEKKKILYKKYPIAGCNYHLQEEDLDAFSEGDELILARDYDNQYDQYAVAVFHVDNYDSDEFDPDLVIGYVPRSENKMIALLLEMGWEDAITAELTKINRSGSWTDRLEMAIYIQSKDECETEGDEDRLYAMYLNDASYAHLVDDLTQKGSAYFRWGGLPFRKGGLPREGDLVLLIRKEVSQSIFYFMKLVAVGDKAWPFLEHPEEELTMIDDCSAYILINIKQPISIQSKDLEFLYAQDISDLYPKHIQSEAVLDKVYALIL